MLTTTIQRSGPEAINRFSRLNGPLALFHILEESIDGKNVHLLSVTSHKKYYKLVPTYVVRKTIPPLQLTLVCSEVNDCLNT